MKYSFMYYLFVVTPYNSALSILLNQIQSLSGNRSGFGSVNFLVLLHLPINIITQEFVYLFCVNNKRNTLKANYIFAIVNWPAGDNENLAKFNVGKG